MFWEYQSAWAYLRKSGILLSHNVEQNYALKDRLAEINAVLNLFEREIDSQAIHTQVSSPTVNLKAENIGGLTDYPVPTTGNHVTV